MSSEETLEELRLKIMESMAQKGVLGKLPTEGKEKSPSTQQDMSRKRERGTVEEPDRRNPYINREHSSGTMDPRNPRDQYSRRPQNPRYDNSRQNLTRNYEPSNTYERRNYDRNFQSNTQSNNYEDRNRRSNGGRERERVRYTRTNHTQSKDYNNKSKWNNRRVPPGSDTESSFPQKNYNLSALDCPIYPNIVKSKTSCQLIINNLKNNDDTDDSIGPKRVQLREYLESFAKSLGPSNKLKSFTISPLDEDYVVVEFDSAKTTTLALSCRSFFNKKIGLLRAEWSRPNDYVEPVDNLEKFCGANVIALEELDGLQVKDVDAKVKSLIEPLHVSDYTVQPLVYKETHEGSEETTIFTGVVVLVFNEMVPIESLSVKYFRPNVGKLSQTTASFTFQQISKLVTEQKHPDSSVLVLLNCVDPLDLKNLQFADEIETTLKNTIENVEEVKLVRPGIDYRLTFDHLEDGVGNVYAKFKSPEVAKEAMRQLSDSQFNDRTLLCAFIDEEDYKKVGIL